MNELTEERKSEYLIMMQEEVNNDDFESAHAYADDILCDILKEIGGFDDILNAYEEVGKWYA